ncbi:hypothetical protein MMC07_001004 [Pseudocyphellaria aurata]|nr:hypothetical protein [Pseudocyphellaria aurata]
MTPAKVPGVKVPGVKVPGVKVPGVKGPKISSNTRYKLRSSIPPQPSESSPTTGSATGTPVVLSPLERLPTELLEKVFFECLNVNLPKASPTLGFALSSFHVKSQLLFKSFSSDRRYGRQHHKELIDVLGTNEEVANLQSSILRLRWMNLAFVHQCIPIFLTRKLPRQSLRWVCARGSQTIENISGKIENISEKIEKTRDIPSKTHPVNAAQTIGVRFALVIGVSWRRVPCSGKASTWTRD